MSAFGVGTLLGAFILPKLRKRISLDHTKTCGTILFAASMASLAWCPTFALGIVSMAGAGIAWVIVNSCLNVGVQLAVPTWVRARALAIYILIYQGSLAIGSAIWGAVAQAYGLSLPLWLAGACMAVGLLIGVKYKLGGAEQMDTRKSDHWKDPTVVKEPRANQGPVLVTVEYKIDPNSAYDFANAMTDLSLQRRRDGAFQWHLFCDLSNPSRYVEMFMVESWGEHVRQHERVMNADRIVEDRVNSFHIDERATIVRHMLSAYALDEATMPPR